MVEGIQHGPVTPSVRMCHTISTVEAVHYKTTRTAPGAVGS